MAPRTKFDVVLRDFKLKDCKWIGENQSGEMSGYTGANRQWFKAIPKGTFDLSYRIARVFVCHPTSDIITKMQFVIGDDPEIEFQADNYTEILVIFNGAVHAAEELNMKICKNQDVWVRPLIGSDPNADETLEYFLAVQCSGNY